MLPLVTGETALRNLFAALTEHTFQVEFGVADPGLTDYLTDLLLRFSRADAMHRFRDAEGRRMTQVADMVAEAMHREGQPCRELHRHIGDYTLFWSGIYPEALSRLQSAERKDHLLDYERQGRESYYIASTLEGDDDGENAPVLRRLSSDFPLVRHGLNRVRHEWDRLPVDELSRLTQPDAA